MLQCYNAITMIDRSRGEQSVETLSLLAQLYKTNAHIFDVGKVEVLKGEEEECPLKLNFKGIERDCGQEQRQALASTTQCANQLELSGGVCGTNGM